MNRVKTNNEIKIVFSAYNKTGENSVDTINLSKVMGLRCSIVNKITGTILTDSFVSQSSGGVSITIPSSMTKEEGEYNICVYSSQFCFSCYAFDLVGTSELANINPVFDEDNGSLLYSLINIGYVIIPAYLISNQITYELFKTADGKLVITVGGKYFYVKNDNIMNLTDYDELIKTYLFIPIVNLDLVLPLTSGYYSLPSAIEASYAYNRGGLVIIYNSGEDTAEAKQFNLKKVFSEEDWNNTANWSDFCSIKDGAVVSNMLHDNSISFEKLSEKLQNKISLKSPLIRNVVSKNTISNPTSLFWSEPLEFPNGKHKIISNFNNYQGITDVFNGFIQNPSTGCYNTYDAKRGDSSFLITGTGSTTRLSTDNGVVHTTGLGETVGDGMCGVLNDGTPLSIRIVNTGALAKYLGKDGSTIYPNFDTYTYWGNDDTVGIIIKDTSITAGSYNIDRIRLSGRFRYYDNIGKYVMIGKNYNPNNAVTETSTVDGADANQNYAPTNVYLVTTTDFVTFSSYKIMSYNQTPTYGTRIGQINPVEPTFELFDNGNICIVIRNNGENSYGGTFCADGSLSSINSTTKWYLYRYNKSFTMMIANIDNIISGLTPAYNMAGVVSQIENSISKEENRLTDLISIESKQIAGPFLPKEGYKLSAGGHFLGIIPRIAKRVIDGKEFAVFVYFNRHLTTSTKLNRQSVYCTVIPFSELLSDGVDAVNKYSCHLLADYSNYVSSGTASPEGGNSAVTTYANGICVFVPVNKSSGMHGENGGGEIIFVPDNTLMDFYNSDLYL